MLEMNQIPNLSRKKAEEHRNFTYSTRILQAWNTLQEVEAIYFSVLPNNFKETW